MNVHTLVLGMLSTNCYLIEDEKTKNAIVVDAPAEADKITDYATSHGLKITDIILTHGHFDHILALSELIDKTDATLSVYNGTVSFLYDRILNLCHYVNIETVPVKPDKILNDGDIIDYYGNKIKVIHTPGHTEDSICLYFENNLIAGDTLFNLSVGRWDHPTGDMYTEITSIKEKLLTLPDDTMVYPGHGESTTIGKERRENPYLL